MADTDIRATSGAPIEVAAQMRAKAEDSHDAWASTLREWADKLDPPDKALWHVVIEGGPAIIDNLLSVVRNLTGGRDFGPNATVVIERLRNGLENATWCGQDASAAETLRESADTARGVEQWDVKDTAAALAFLFAEEIPAPLRETLADLPQPTIDTVRELVKLRGGENG